MQFDGTNYESLTEGQSFSTVEFSITKSMNMDFQSCFSFSFSDDESANTGQEEDRNEFVNPVLIANFSVMKEALAWPTGVLHARELMCVYEGVACDEPLLMKMRVKNKLIKKDRKFLVLELQAYKRQSGIMALEVERTLVWP